MSKTFLDEAIKERARLQAELEASEIYQRLHLLDTIIAHYGGLGAKARTMGSQAKANARTTLRQSGAPTKEGEILQLATACIKAQDGYASKRAIHQYVTLHGVEVSEAALSAYLSKAETLSFDRERGWALRDAPRTTAEIVPLAISTAARTASTASAPSEAVMVTPQELWASEKIF
jgi:hypothetical protein